MIVEGRNNLNLLNEKKRTGHGLGSLSPKIYFFVVAFFQCSRLLALSFMFLMFAAQQNIHDTKDHNVGFIVVQPLLHIYNIAESIHWRLYILSSS